MDHGGVVAQLFAAYPMAEVPDQTVAVYLKHLRDIPVTDLQAAVDDAIDMSIWLPTIAEIRKCHEARVRYRVHPDNWVVGSGPRRNLLQEEAMPIRILREIQSLRDADMVLHDGAVWVTVLDTRVAERHWLRHAKRTLASAGLDVDVQFVQKENAE